MDRVFSYKAYEWQRNIILHLFMMQIPHSGVSPAPVLLVCPTGGGKLSVRDVYSVMNAGISLMITPLLSLGADQASKITLKAKHNKGNICSIHLDKIRSKVDQTKVVTMIQDIPFNSQTLIILFTSPQALLNKHFPWGELLNWLIHHSRLSMVCIDKVHLFVHFGMTFRKEFKDLTPLLFDKLKVAKVGNKSRTTIPILFMTATCTKTVVDVIASVTGLNFETDINVFWPSSSSMTHQHVFLEVQYSTSGMSLFKKKVGPSLKTSTVHKFILYSNIRSTVLQVTPKLCEWIDHAGYKADILKIVGTLHRDQKFYHVRVFTKSNASP